MMNEKIYKEAVAIVNRTTDIEDLKVKTIYLLDLIRGYEAVGELKIADATITAMRRHINELEARIQGLCPHNGEVKNGICLDCGAEAD